MYDVFSPPPRSKLARRFSEDHESAVSIECTSTRTFFQTPVCVPRVESAVILVQQRGARQTFHFSNAICFCTKFEFNNILSTLNPDHMMLKPRPLFNIKQCLRREGYIRSSQIQCRSVGVATIIECLRAYLDLDIFYPSAHYSPLLR